MTGEQLKQAQRLMNEMGKLKYNLDRLEAMGRTGGILLLKDQNGHTVTTALLEDEDRTAVIAVMEEATRKALAQRAAEFSAL